MAIDRRIQRTRTALYDALVRLIRAKPYAEISVGDILAEADIGRSTFYAHFHSKDELLDRSLDRLKQLLVSTIAEAGTGASFWDASRTLFEHLAEYRDIHATLDDGPRNGRGGEVLQGALNRVVGEVVRETLPPVQGTIPRDLAVAFVTSSFATVLAWWLHRHPERSPVEADALFRQLTGQGLGT